ncbi:MAG: hypothetical protein ACLPX9_08830, partial [Rhodomicrobium sp.]
WAPTASSTASYGAGLTGRAYINRLNGRFEIARRGGQLPFLGSEIEPGLRGGRGAILVSTATI